MVTLARPSPPTSHHIAGNASGIAVIVGSGEAFLANCHQLILVDGLGIECHALSPVADTANTSLQPHNTIINICQQKLPRELANGDVDHVEHELYPKSAYSRMIEI